MGNTTKTISKNGDKIFWNPEICNTGSETCYGTFGKLIIPDGVELVFRGINENPTPSYDEGIFNWQEKEWHLGEVDGQTCHNIHFEFEVVDISLAVDGLFTVVFSAMSSCVEKGCDNAAYLNLEVKDECETINLRIGPTVGEKVSCSTNIKIGK